MPRAQSGYTLVELLVAMAVLAIIGSIAVVGYRDYVETAQLGTMRQRIDALLLFQENYRSENDAYLAGVYVPGGQNDFLPAGYVVRDDNDDIRLEVTACDGGDIEDCFKVTATNSSGQEVVWNNGSYR